MSDQKFIPLSGYTDRLSARPGDMVEVRVSSLSLKPFQASLVRVRYADPNPEGPGGGQDGGGPHGLGGKLSIT